MYHAEITDNFTDFTVTGYLRPKFHWNQGQLQVTNLMDQSNLSIPSSVPISIWQSIKLRLIFRKQIFAYLVSIHAGYAFHMKICAPNCSTCTTPTANWNAAILIE